MTGMNILKIAFLLYVFTIGSACAGERDSDQPPADAVYVNGRIWTGNPAQPWASSMAVSDGRIVSVGPESDIQKWRGEATEYQDLNDHFVSPGFQDSHIHMMYIASPQVDLAGADTLAAMQQRIREFAEANPDSPWITGFGWGYGAFPDRRPLASHLDAVVSDRPVFVRARDGHMALANTVAMQLAGIDTSTADPENGRIVRAENGEATGELQESAMTLLDDLVPPPTEAQRYRALLNTMDQAAAAGITAIHEAGVSQQDIQLFERAESEGKLLRRVELAFRMVTPADRQIVPVQEAKDHIRESIETRDRLTGPFVRARSIKGMLDGTVDAATAAMFDNFVGTDTAGIPFWDLETLQSTVAMYDEAGFQVILHAIGDRAISDALDAFAYARTANRDSDRRHRVEHAEIPRVDDLARFRELNVIASTQAMFAYPDDTVLQNFSVLLGHDRAQHADSFAMWDNAGVRQVFGSDYPVMTLSVLKGIEAAATRMTESGKPPGGWYPEGRIPVDAALRHYTSDSAWGTHDDAERGSLEIGKFADFVVLSENILDIDPTTISEVQVLQTVMHGRTTYVAKSERLRRLSSRGNTSFGK
jgi:predicted amidohydrolase YtcJ